MPIEKQPIFSMSVTPFKENGDLDLDAYRAMLRFQANAGCGVWLLSYGSGEGHLVDHDEMLTLYETGAKELRGKVPVYAAGAGLGPCTRDFIKLAKEIAQTGVECIQLHHPRPAYPLAPPKLAECEQYFIDVLEAVRFPMAISIHPGAIPNLPLPRMEFVKKLVDTYPHLWGFNVSMSDTNYLLRIKETVGTRAFVRGGGYLQAATLGLDGCLVLDTNIAPRLAISIFQNFRAGRVKEAAEAQKKQMKLGEVIIRYRNPQSLKMTLRILGLPGGYVRRPYLELDDSAKKELTKVLEDLEIRKIESIN